MKIRPATPEDAAALAAIYAPVVAHTAISFETEPPDAAEMAARVAKTTQAGLPWLVAEDAAAAVCGYAYAGRHRERAAYQWSVDTTIYIADGHRGQGVGRRLYEALLPLLAELGYCQAFSGIALPNAASVGLHEALGFAPLGVYRNVGFKQGQWRDVGWWQRELRAPDPAPEPPRAYLPG